MRLGDFLIVQLPAVYYVPPPPADAPHVLEALRWARNGSRPEHIQPDPGVSARQLAMVFVARLRLERGQESAWMNATAGAIVRRLDARRSWFRAYAAAKASQD